MSNSFQLTPSLMKHLVEFNRTKRPVESKSLIEQFKTQVAKSPQAIVVRYKDLNLTYKQLDEMSDSIAHYLVTQLGLARLEKQNIVFALERNEKMIAVILAILKVDGTYVPFDPSQPNERLHYVLADSTACLLITGRVHRGRQNLCTEVILDNIKFDQKLPPFPAITKVPSSSAYIMYTSGSTGRPKGVKVSQQAITRLVINSNTINVSPESVFAQVGNIAFDASTFEIWGPLLNGASVVVIPYETVIDSTALQNELNNKMITDVFFSVALFNQLAVENPNAFGCIKNLLVGGDVLNPKSIASVLGSDTPPKQMWNGYGPTENTTFTTMHPISLEDCHGKAIPIGRPIANTTCYVLNSKLQPLAIGVSGELYISGIGLAEGYLNKPDKTQEAFIANPFYQNEHIRKFTPATAIMYKTGDRVRWLDDGTLEFIGRVDNQVKIRGFRIELGEVESLLIKLPEVEQAVVVAKEHDGQKQLFAYCVSQTSQSKILTSFRSQVPAYMIPSGVNVMDSFPLTDNGKVDRRKLPKPDFYSTTYQQEIIAPRTTTERILIEIWKALLTNLKEVSAEDHFFDIGGHSLLVIRMIDQIHKQLDTHLDVKTVFNNPILAKLADIIDGNESQKSDEDEKRCKQDQWLQLNKPFISAATADMKNILLTGATGFLGAHLLHELQKLLPKVIIHCLVRGNNTESATKKLLENTSKYRVPVDLNRIEILCGDLNEKKLGLNNHTWNKIANKIDSIYHCGAWVNHLHSYSTLRHANVVSTIDLLELCQQGNPKQIFYISTLWSAPTDKTGIREKYVASVPNATNGYTRSKWVSERLIEQAFEQGTIYRMGNVTGCTRHGASNFEINHTLNLIKGCLQMGAAPNWNSYELDISPADILAALLIKSSIQSLHSREIVNLGYLTFVNWREKLEHLAGKGFKLKFVCPKEWAKQWVPHIDTRNALYPFKSFYLEPKEYPQINVEREYVEQFGPAFDLDTLLDTYYQYWSENGFISNSRIE